MNVSVLICFVHVCYILLLMFYFVLYQTHMDAFSYFYICGHNSINNMKYIVLNLNLCLNKYSYKFSNTKFYSTLIHSVYCPHHHYYSHNIPTLLQDKDTNLNTSVYYLHYYFAPCEFFTLALTGGLSLGSEWHKFLQVSREMATAMKQKYSQLALSNTTYLKREKTKS